MGLEGNTEADLEAKRGTTLPQSSASFLPAQLSNGINRVSLTTGITATHMPESPAVSTSSSTGNAIGSGTSASHDGPAAHWSFSVAGRISLDIFTVSDAGTLPPVYTAPVYTFLPDRCPFGQARRDICLGGKFNTDPPCLWDFLEQIGVVTHTPDWE